MGADPIAGYLKVNSQDRGIIHGVRFLSLRQLSFLFWIESTTTPLVGYAFAGYKKFFL